MHQKGREVLGDLVCFLMASGVQVPSEGVSILVRNTRKYTN